MTGYRTIDHDARRADLTYMAEHGETREGAAGRLNVSREALEKWCRHNGCADLWHALGANETRLGHVARGRVAVVIR